MCNAAKHSPGCMCGFGPPYPPSYSTTHVTEWAEEAYDDPSIVPRSLLQEAWDEAGIEAFLHRYNLIRESDLPEETAISRIRELLRLRRKEVEEVRETFIKVPLYRFSAPPVKGATVEYSEGESLVKGGGWLLKVLGVGVDQSTSLQVNKSHTWIAAAGTCKLVYIPIKMRVRRVAIYDGDRLVGRGHEARVAPLRETADPHLRRRSVLSLPRSSCHEGPRDHLDVVEQLLAGDLTDVVHKASRAWEAEVSHEVRVQLQGFADVSALVRLKRTRRLQLEFSLPAGHNYRAYLCKGSTWWDSPRLDSR